MKKTISLLLFCKSTVCKWFICEHASVSKRHSKYYEIPVSSGDTITTKVSNLDDNADLYVGVGYRPKSSKNDCKINQLGNTNWRVFSNGK
jgi:hypothetical protein